VVGQLLYVFGLEDKPDLAAIDQAVGLRSAASPLSGPDAGFYLLCRGFKFVIFGTYDVQSFLRLGKLYLMAFYGKGWTAEHDEHFTPAEVARLQRLDRQHQIRMKPYRSDGRAQAVVNRRPTQNDVVELLRKGYAVDVTYELGHRRRVQHAALLVPDKRYSDCSKVWLYFPDYSGRTVSSLNLDDALQAIRYDWGVAGVWR